MSTEPDCGGHVISRHAVGMLIILGPVTPADRLVSSVRPARWAA